MRVRRERQRQIREKFSGKSLLRNGNWAERYGPSAAFPAGPEIAPALRHYRYSTVKQRAV